MAAGRSPELNTRETSVPAKNMEALELRLRRWAEERSLPAAYVQKWLSLDEPGRIGLLKLAESLKMRAGQCVAALALLEEIATRESQTIAEILDRATLRRIVNSPGSGPGRARLMLDELRAMRYPQLNRAARRLSERVAALKLPPAIKIVLPRDLASDEVRVQIVAHGQIEMEEALGCLRAKTRDLIQLAGMLAGAESGLLDAE
jgi:hypothetical protein